MRQAHYRATWDVGNSAGRLRRKTTPRESKTAAPLSAATGAGEEFERAACAASLTWQPISVHTHTRASTRAPRTLPLSTGNAYTPTCRGPRRNIVCDYCGIARRSRFVLFSTRYVHRVCEFTYQRYTISSTNFSIALCVSCRDSAKRQNCFTRLF